jgi:hypothetical protein
MAEIRYILELFLRDDFPPEAAIAADDYSRTSNIYVFDTAPPFDSSTSYWVTAFGGNYEDLTGTTNIQVIMGEFLQLVDNASELEAVENSFFIDGTKVYYYTTYKPWQYFTTDTEVEILEGFSSAPKDANNPSDIKYSGVKYPAILKAPSAVNKLSDSASGLALFLTWSATLYNNDGRFDDTNENNFFNVPARLLKSNEESPSRSDFNIIRYGFVDDQKTTFSDFTVTSADYLRSFSEEVCDTYTSTEFSNIPDAAADKRKPKIWGSVDGVSLTAIDSTDSTKYYAGDFVTAVSAVYDSDGNSLSFSFASGTGIITESTSSASYADVTGSSSNMIGEIVRDVIEDRGGINYSVSFWDIAEADNYILDSPKINYIYSGGTVKNFVTDVLSNDFAFLIQKNRGVLTLRKWGEEYGVHFVDSWEVTQAPSKNHTAGQDNYMSSVLINYDENQQSGEYGKTLFYDDEEAVINEEFRKKQTGEYNLSLAEDADVQAFAELAIDRFGRVPETITIGVSADTSGVELLDLYQLSMQINGRTFSQNIGWIVKSIDPAQDKLILEASTYYKKAFNDGRASLNRSETQYTIDVDGYAALDIYASFDLAAQVSTRNFITTDNPQADAVFDYAAQVPGVFRFEQE